MSTSWQRLLSERRIQRHTAARDEIARLIAAIDRNIADASNTQVSADNRFGIAYEAARNAATIAIAASGYRVRGTGAHATTFEALAIAIGPDARALVLYLDQCRRKRNMINYDAIDIATSREADELVEKARQLRELVLNWLSARHPHLL